MIFWISLLLASSSPALESPEATLPDRSKAEDESPDSMSEAKEEGVAEYRNEDPGREMEGRREERAGSQ